MSAWTMNVLTVVVVVVVEVAGIFGSTVTGHGRCVFKLFVDICGLCWKLSIDICGLGRWDDWKETDMGSEILLGKAQITVQQLESLKNWKKNIIKFSVNNSLPNVSKIKAQLPHPIYACVFYHALHFGSSNIGFHERQWKYFQNAMQCQKIEA